MTSLIFTLLKTKTQNALCDILYYIPLSIQQIAADHWILNWVNNFLLGNGEEFVAPYDTTNLWYIILRSAILYIHDTGQNRVEEWGKDYHGAKKAPDSGIS